MHGNALAEFFHELHRIMRFWQTVFGLKGQVPVFPLHHPTGRHCEGVPWTELPYPLKNRLGTWDIEIREVIIQGLGIESSLDARVLQNRLDLGGKQKFLPIPVVIEGLNADAI